MSTETRGGRPTSIVYDAKGVPEVVYQCEELAVVEGPDEGKSVRLERAVVRIGSHRGSDLCLHDRAVSRHHFELRRTPAGWEVHDLGSTNGTLYEGSRVHAALLPMGAVLVVGRSRLELRERTEQKKLLVSRRTRFGDLVGQSSAIRRVYALLERAAEAEVTVLLEGETGTGKELAARALHEHSKRASGPFVVVDCGSVAKTLIQSELFGHARGSFTGADRDRAGAFEAAGGGTVFLDEIGELPMELQPMLLRVIETREVRRIGETQSRPVHVRLVAATNRDLMEEVRRGCFREDLYYRVGVFRVRLPALRERPEDMPVLVRHFLRDHPGVEPSAAVLRKFARAAWPGNIRELRNVVERALLLSFDEVTTDEESRPSAAPALAASLADPDRKFKEAKDALVSAFEKDYVSSLLERTGRNVSKAAREAGIDRKHFERLMRKHGITR